MLSFDSNAKHFLVNNSPVNFTHDELSQMNEIRWWHSIPFSTQVKSKGFSDAISELPNYLLADVDFKNKHVLDIGCWDGFQLFYAESQGATRVVGVDDLSQRHSGPTGRDFAKSKLNSKAEFYDINVYDLSPQRAGQYDIVMMFGVLYHLVHPMLGIEKMCSVAKDEILLSTHFLPVEDSIPLCVLYPQGELEGDHTNWSGPNLCWIRNAFEIQGFKVLKEHVYRHDRVTIHAKRVANDHTRNSKLNASRDTTLINNFEKQQS